MANTMSLRMRARGLRYGRQGDIRRPPALWVVVERARALGHGIEAASALHSQADAESYLAEGDLETPPPANGREDGARHQWAGLDSLGTFLRGSLAWTYTQLGCRLQTDEGTAFLERGLQLFDGPHTARDERNNRANRTVRRQATLRRHGKRAELEVWRTLVASPAFQAWPEARRAVDRLLRQCLDGQPRRALQQSTSRKGSP
ncbi:MAG: hypothetical protein R3F43_09930 [bacterium]